ncbi:MAG: HD domain-containing protein [Adlercreutzia equolifaciens]
MTAEEVERTFNPQVRALVDGVTKISRIEVESLSDEQAQTIRKMFVAMSKDIRVILIKMADRLHNMRTLAALREDRRIFKSRETLEIYAPIAHRLGINSIKWELEDLFFYLEPNNLQVSRMVTESRAERGSTWPTSSPCSTRRWGRWEFRPRSWGVRSICTPSTRR